MPYLVPYGYGVQGMAPRVKNFQRRSLPWQGEGLLRHKGLSNMAWASPHYHLSAVNYTQIWH